MRIAERIPSSPPSPVTVAAQCAPGGQALLVSAPLQIAHAGNVPHNVPPAGAPAQEESSVIPSVPPHVLALRELPVTAAQRAIVLLEALVKRRREHVHRVLESHSVPDELRDPCNLTCGLRGVTFIAEVQGPSAGRGIWRHELKLFQLSTKGTRVEAPSLAMLLSKVDTLSGLSSPESLASAMSATSTSPARMPTEVTQATLTAEGILLRLPIVAAVPLETAGILSELPPTVPVVKAVPWPTALAPLDGALLAPSHLPGLAAAPTTLVHPQRAKPSAERLLGLLKSYLLCCTCATAARGAAAVLGVPPQADASWMADDELVNELHGLLSHEVLFVYVQWMVSGRLVQVAPHGASLESLMSRAQASSYRLPLQAFAAACAHLWRARRSVQGSDRLVWPVHIKANDNEDGHGRITAGSLNVYMSMLRGWARGELMASIVHNEQVEEALTFARRELRLAPLASTPPLVHAIVRAAFEHLTAKHDWELRLALWMVLAVALKARTHEGCTLMHDDLVIAPGNRLGWWQVPLFTKTSDGLEGKVARYVRKSTCRHRLLTVVQTLALTEVDLLRCALGVEGVDERLRYDDVCLCCLHRLVWHRQSKCRGCVDALTFVFQEVEGDHRAERADGTPSAGQFTGRVVTPEALLLTLRFVLRQVVRSRKASGQPALVGIETEDAADAYVLYSARKGGFINDLCSDGYLPREAAQAGRILEMTMMRYYRRHELMDDALERNGAFGEVRERLVFAEARRLGVDAPPARVRELAQRVGLTIASAGELSEEELWALLESHVAGNAPRWAAAAAALLQASSMNRQLTGALVAREPVGCPSGEDDALRPEDVLALVQREVRLAVLDEMDAIERSATMLTTQLGSGQAPVHELTLTLPEEEDGLTPLAEDGEVALTREDGERLSVDDAWRGGLERVLVALPAREQAALLWDWRLKSRLEIAATEGAQVASVEQALGRLWITGARAVLLWRQGLRWLEATLEDLSVCVSGATEDAVGGDARTVRSVMATLGGSRTRRVIEFELEAYATGWVVLIRAGGTTNSECLPNHSLLVALAPPQVAFAAACIPEESPIVVAAQGQVGFTAGANGCRPAEAMVVDAGPVVDAVPIDVLAVSTRSEPKDPSWIQSGEGACRQRGESSLVVRKGSSTVQPRALFTRTSLANIALPKVSLIPAAFQANLDEEGLRTVLKARLEAQREATGHLGQAVLDKVASVRRFDHYLQAATAGYAGVFDAIQRDWLSRHRAYIGLAFLDMCRSSGEGLQARLAFPRGGVASMVIEAVTRREVEALLTVMAVEDLGATDAERRRAVMVALDPTDARLVQGMAILNGTFARVVRAMHAEGGVFEHTGSAEALEGVEQRLHIGDNVVRRVTVFWACQAAPNVRDGLRTRLQKAGLNDVVGVRNVGAYAFDTMNRVRPFAESSIIAMKQALSWYLLACCGWPSVRMSGRGKVPDYTAVLALQHRPVVQAYALARQLSVRQHVYRAMAATEEVMHELLSVLVLGVACDLLHAAIFTLAYMVALRVSDVHALNLENLAFGKHARTNDILVTLPNSKADGAGEGFKRWVQHPRSCPCASKALSQCSDGLAWCVASTMGWQFDTSTGDIPVCNACVLLMYLDLSGALTHVRAGTGKGVPVFRALTYGGRFSWLMGKDARRLCQTASASDFSEQRLPYEAYNDGLHLVVDRVNELRTDRGVAAWPRNEAHFHMFRHGHVIMELVFGASLSELMRSARLDPSTVASYIAHVSTTYAALVQGAEGRSNAAEQLLVVERGQVEDLVQVMTTQLLTTPTGKRTVDRLGGASSGRQQMAVQVHGLFDALGLSVRGLRSCSERVRQVLVYGCAVRLVDDLDWGLVEPLLAALGGGRAFDTEPPPTVSVPVLVTHVRGLDALGAAGSSGSTSEDADVVHDDEYDSMYDGATVVGAAEDGDDRTLPPSVDELEEQWQAMHGQLWRASR